jgi:hypothetical protein
MLLYATYFQFLQTCMWDGEYEVKKYMRYILLEFRIWFLNAIYVNFTILQHNLRHFILMKLLLVF